MSNIADVPERFISIKEFVRRSTLSRSEVYNKIKEGELPRPTKLGENRVAFPERVWADWASSKMEAT